VILSVPFFIISNQLYILKEGKMRIKDFQPCKECKFHTNKRIFEKDDKVPYGVRIKRALCEHAEACQRVYELGITKGKESNAKVHKPTPKRVQRKLEPWPDEQGL
jgi:hypothetical protein